MHFDPHWSGRYSGRKCLLGALLSWAWHPGILLFFVLLLAVYLLWVCTSLCAFDISDLWFSNFTVVWSSIFYWFYMRSENFQPLFAVTILLLCFSIRSAFVCQYVSPFLCVCLVFVRICAFYHWHLVMRFSFFLFHFRSVIFSEVFLKSSGFSCFKR